MKVDKSNKHDVVVAAVEALKKCEFKATAIKVELEAQFNRGDAEDCPAGNTCYECDGDWEDASDCESCLGNGIEGEENCPDCGGTGRQNCTYCDFGEQTCDGECEAGEWGSNSYCQSWILEQLAQYGLSERNGDGDGFWVCKRPLSYAKFYTDGSVDSEFTFTLMLDNPENIFLLPKVVEVFNALGGEIDNGIDVDGAGMHMALLDTEDGSYGRNNNVTDVQLVRYQNFQKSMSLLLPALYCLGTSCERTRGLSFRRPEVNMSSHRAAIDYRHGALEFRIFDTCYDKPEHILDNVVVMSKCMRYWRSKYRTSGMEKIASEVRFGREGNYTLERFYITTTHIDLLNAGLRKLKPSYYTIKQIKEQRKLAISKRTINSKLRDFRKSLSVEYEEYSSRYDWSLVVRRHRRTADLLEAYGKDTDMEKVEKETEQFIKDLAKQRQKLEEYAKKREEEYLGREGDYRLCAV